VAPARGRHDGGRGLGPHGVAAQDSPERRRVVSAPSAPVEYGEPLPLRWPAPEGYILSSHPMGPQSPTAIMAAPGGGHHNPAYVPQQRTPGMGGALILLLY
jgi:hypothetical protein